MAEYIELSQATTLFGDVDARFDTVEGKIPSNASSSNKLATASDITSITEKIPVNASSSNKLVTEADIAAAYHAAGTKTVAELLSSLLVAANEGNVYNMTDAGTTTADFIEGAGKPIRIGDNVGVCKIGNDYKFDLLSGFIDTSNFVEKSSTSGLLKNDGTVDTTSYVETVSGKGLSTNDYTNNDKTALQTTIPLEITQLQGSVLNKVDKVTGKGLSTNDYDATAKGKVDGMDASITASQNGSTALTKATVGWTCKNHIHAKLSDIKAINTIGTWSDNTYTRNGITFTVNTTADGYVSNVIVNGTNTGNDNVVFELLHDIRSEYEVGDKLSLTGCPTGGSLTTYGLSVRYYGYDFGEGRNITISSQSGNTWTGIVVFQGATVDNLTFYPMLRPASISDSTYEPYHESVEEWGFPRAEQSVLGAKNLLETTATSATINSVTFTVNSDGSVSTTNTATANATLYINLQFYLPVGKIVKLTGCPSGGSGNTYYLRIGKKSSASDGWGTDVAIDTGNGVEFTVPENSYGFSIGYAVTSGVDMSGKTAYPMIRLASDPDDTYVPYAMTNRELTENKLDISKLKTVVAASSDFADFQTRIAAL